ncbi:kinase-like domain-containing protein [Chytriomyces cf. hyalinus JEL632]|nr:kinase-like domain-containing protein [Chytriomyces cf. hyalinus JEL632]
METDTRSGEQRKHRHHHHHKNHSHSKSDLVIRERKLKQGRLLLVSLLENFCMLYDQSPEKNKRLFFLLCKQLSAMGIIESDDVLDEISAVRGAYKRAFKELVMQAMQAIHEETSVKSLPGPEGEGSQGDDLGNDSLALILKRQSIFQSGTSMSDKFESVAVGMVMGVITPSLNGGAPSQQHFADILDLHTSRYCEDFEENRVLGKGAFGQVWCVRNRLDDVQYAVKRISLKQSTTGMEKILREVKVQARLSHPNVVRYFSCWLEHAKPATKTAAFDDDAFGADSIDSTGYSATNSNAEQSLEACEKSNQIPVPSKGCLPAATATPLRRYYNNIADTSLYSASPSKQKSGSTSKDNLTLKELTLFIQMELCGSSLQFYLNHRNKAIFNPLYPNISETDFLVSINVPFCVSITRDICEGLDYIHSQGCIHRDIAPKNIFWKDSESILSRMSSSFSGMTAGSPIPSPPTPSATMHSDVVLPDSHQSGMKYHTTGVGTESYASPEQLSKTTSMYSSKSDMYSAGIVFFELLHPIGTGMERARTFSNLRLGVLPEEFVKRFPKEATLVLWLMNKNPEDRPSARETLDLDLFASGSSSAGQSLQSKSFGGFHPDEFSSSESRLSRAEASESKRPIYMAIPAVTGAGAGLHKRSLIENITSTVKSWIHHSNHREKAVASLESMGIGNAEVECIVAHPERALEMIVDARSRAEKAEKEAADAKGEIARLKARIQALEDRKVK